MTGTSISDWVRPIAEAPIADGVEYGPCLLGRTDGEEAWTVGRWNGEAWIDSDGWPFLPVVFGALGPITDVLVFLGLARSSS